jgi:hypothetical protein
MSSRTFSQYNRFKLFHYDEAFLNSPNRKVLEFEASSAGVKHSIERTTQIFYDINTTLGFVASCDCGSYSGNYYAGSVCPKCGSIVQSQFAENMEHQLWLDIPQEFVPIPHPVFFKILKTWMGMVKSPGKKRVKLSVLDAIVDPEQDLPANVKTHIHGQGLTYFYNNFDDIMQFFLEVYPKTKKSADTKYIEFLYTNEREHLFLRKFPLLNPALTPQGKEGRMRAIDKPSTHILTAITDLNNLKNSHRRTFVRSKYVDKMLWRVYENILQYTKDIIKEKLGQKFAHVRKHVMGTRIHCSSRTVISPIVVPHKGDEIHCPWEAAVNIYGLQLRNVMTNRKHPIVDPVTGKITKRAYTPAEAEIKYRQAQVMYDPDVHAMLETLMREAGGFFPVLMGRNPTLVHGGILYLKLAKIKTDINDRTYSIPPIWCKGPNNDFDGDEMYVIHIQEQGMVEHVQNLHPKQLMLDKENLAVSGTVAPTAQAAVHLNSFLHTAYDVPESVRFK